MMPSSKPVAPITPMTRRRRWWALAPLVDNFAERYDAAMRDIEKERLRYWMLGWR